MSALVDEEESAAAGASSSACVGVIPDNMAMPMVRCSAMSWTDVTGEGAQVLNVLATRRDLVICAVTAAVTMTEEQTVQRARFTGTVAEKCFMERQWCERQRQAMLRVDKHKRNASIRAV